MAQAKKHILPFFIPHLGCPQQCIFCDQHKIAGQAAPTAEAVWQAIAALPNDQRQDYELAFYGGSFTALPAERQVYYLEPVRRALAEGLLGGARVSTRPDCLDEAALVRLRHFGVGTVELGVQSMEEAVLRQARRGHTAAQSLAAVRRLRQAGFVVGVQLMPGLPGETLASAWAGAQRILAEQPQLLRIYPTVVLQDTELGRIWQQGEYQPLSLEQAAQITLAIKLLAEERGVAVIRMGLQPSPELAAAVLAGPYHPAFGELVQGLYWRLRVLALLRELPAAVLAEALPVDLLVGRRHFSAVVGQKRQNWPYYTEIAPRLRLRALPPERALPDGLLIVQAGGAERCQTEAEFRRDWRRLCGLPFIS